MSCVQYEFRHHLYLRTCTQSVILEENELFPLLFILQWWREVPSGLEWQKEVQNKFFLRNWQFVAHILRRSKRIQSLGVTGGWV